MTRKRTSKVKRYPYIEVEGVKNCYIDASLLQCCDEGALSSSLSDELKVLKKALITPQDIKQNKYSFEELIKRVSPHLLESYGFYNLLANKWDEIQEKTLNRFFDENYINFTLDEWNTEIRRVIDEGEVPFYVSINLLRFYKNGEYKELIKKLFEEEEYVIRFYYETDIQIEGLNINWDEVTKNQFEEILEFDEELEGIEMSKEELLTRKPQEALKIAAKIIEGVTEQVTQLSEVQEYKELYEIEREKIKLSSQKVEDLNQEVKSKEAQIQSLSKENRTLKKNGDNLNNKLEQHQKEVGRLGQSLGEIRKEKEEVEKTNVSLNRRINSLERETNSITEKIENEIKKTYDNKIIKLQLKNDENLNTLERELEKVNKELEEEQAKYEILSAELELVKKEFNLTKNDLRIVEKERNELLEQVNSSLNDVTNEVATSEEDDDLLFDFNEDEIEDFVEFDNKPTRN